MKLPKKYAGITAGGWEYRAGQVIGDFEKGGWYSVIAVMSKDINKVEKGANGILIADAPKLAADVVMLREVLKAAMRGYDLLAEESKETDDKRFIGYVLHGDKCRAAIASTKEYEV